MTIRRITVDEFHAEIRAQGAPTRRDVAFKCVVCGTVQSMNSLIAAGAGANEEEVEQFVGFSCVGRWTGAGPHRDGAKPGAGCDWTLGGFFRLHTVEVITSDGPNPIFELASPAEALALAQKFGEVARPP